MLPTNEDARKEKNFVFMNLYFNRLVTQSSEIQRIVISPIYRQLCLCFSRNLFVVSSVMECAENIVFSDNSCDKYFNL